MNIREHIMDLWLRFRLLFVRTTVSRDDSGGKDYTVELHFKKLDGILYIVKEIINAN